MNRRDETFEQYITNLVGTAILNDNAPQLDFIRENVCGTIRATHTVRWGGQVIVEEGYLVTPDIAERIEEILEQIEGECEIDDSDFYYDLLDLHVAIEDAWQGDPPSNLEDYFCYGSGAEIMLQCTHGHHVTVNLWDQPQANQVIKEIWQAASRAVNWQEVYNRICSN